MITCEEVIEIIKNAGTQADLDKLTPDADLEAIGADSLDRMDILLGIQEATEVEIPDEEIQNMLTARNICDYVNANAGGN